MKGNARGSWRHWNREHKQLALLAGLYVLVSFWLAYRKYAVFGTDSGDYGYFNNMFWWTLRGRPFHNSGIGYSNLALHIAFLWVLLLPAYWLFSGVPVLIFMQSLFLGMTAVPVYLIARHVLKNHRTALVMAAAFILLPPIVSQHVNQVEEPAFAAVFLLFAFYFFIVERFGLFMLFSGIACLGRENIPLAIAMFGVYGLILRRGKKWIIAPLAMGLVYFWFAIFVLLPYFREGHAWHVMKMYTYLGNTPGAIVGNAISHPMLVVHHLLGQQNVTYVVLLLQPLGWVLPFLSPASLMALPDLAINTVSDNGALKVIPWHYNVVTGCFLFVGTIYAVRKVGQWLRQRSWGDPEIAMAVTLLALSISHWFIWLSPQQYQKLPHHETLLRAIAVVPPEKSVLVPIRLVSHIALRDHYTDINLFATNPNCAEQFEYVILDANERQYAPPITQEFFDSFARNPKYKLLLAEQNVFVFQRLGGESDWKIPVQ